MDRYQFFYYFCCCFLCHLIIHANLKGTAPTPLILASPLLSTHIYEVCTSNGVPDSSDSTYLFRWSFRSNSKPSCTSITDHSSNTKPQGVFHKFLAITKELCVNHPWPDCQYHFECPNLCVCVQHRPQLTCDTHTAAADTEGKARDGSFDRHTEATGKGNGTLTNAPKARIKPPGGSNVNSSNRNEILQPIPLE